MIWGISDVSMPPKTNIIFGVTRTLKLIPEKRIIFKHTILKNQKKQNDGNCGQDATRTNIKSRLTLFENLQNGINIFLKTRNANF